MADLGRTSSNIGAVVLMRTAHEGLHVRRGILAPLSRTVSPPLPTLRCYAYGTLNGGLVLPSGLQ